jgi:hypothetical protein
MAKIQPITFPLNAGTATEMSVLILNFQTMQQLALPTTN